MKVHIHHFHAEGAVADAGALEQFQKQWATYQKLVDSDACSHREVGAILHRALAALPRAFAFLDIACGDAGQMRRSLAGTKVRHYHGIDLAEPALALAAKNLTGVPFEVELDHRDFVTALTRRPEPADAGWCGLSIHHLSPERRAAGPDRARRLARRAPDCRRRHPVHACNIAHSDGMGIKCRKIRFGNASRRCVAVVLATGPESDRLWA